LQKRGFQKNPKNRFSISFVKLDPDSIPWDGIRNESRQRRAIQTFHYAESEGKVVSSICRGVPNGVVLLQKRIRAATKSLGAIVTVAYQTRQVRYFAATQP